MGSGERKIVFVSAGASMPGASTSGRQWACSAAPDLRFGVAQRQRARRSSLGLASLSVSSAAAARSDGLALSSLALAAPAGAGAAGRAAPWESAPATVGGMLAHVGRSSAVAVAAAAAAVGALPLEGLAEAAAALALHLKLLVAGASSAVVSRTAMAPLERLKMDQVLRAAPSGCAVQAAAAILRAEGLGGFWKGNALNLLRTVPYKAINFTGYEMFAQLLQRASGSDGNGTRFLAGACAGITATLLCFPLDVVRTRVLLPGGGYGGAVATLRGILAHEGLPGLYTGIVPALVAMAPAGAAFYGTYSALKAGHLERMAAEQRQQQDGGGAALEPGQLELPAAYTLLYGAAAGAVSECVVYPLEVLRRRLQMAAAQAAGGGAAAATPGAGAVCGRIGHACGALLKERGVRAFYAGMGPNMLQVLPAAALSMGTYEAVKYWVDAHLPHNVPAAKQGASA